MSPAAADLLCTDWSNKAPPEPGVYIAELDTNEPEFDFPAYAYWTGNHWTFVLDERELRDRIGSRAYPALPEAAYKFHLTHPDCTHNLYTVSWRGLITEDGPKPVWRPDES